MDDFDKFRDEYRLWLRDHIPVIDGGRADDKSDAATARRWMRILRDGGYGAKSWPVEFGGMDAPLAQQIVMLEEESAAHAPDISALSIGLVHAGLTLIHHGTEAQQSEHLPKILSGETLWCQGFSEPSAGSDLVSLQTRALRDRDHFIVNGQKVWSSWATHADWCLLLVRTDAAAPKRKGISYLMMDMKSPGVEVRSLRQLNGDTEFCEIFLDDVSIPVANLLGAENDGWRVSQTTLASERGPLFLPSIQRLRARTHDAVCQLRDSGKWDDPLVHQTVMRDYIDVENLVRLYAQVLSHQTRSGEPGPAGMLIKLAYSETLVRSSGTMVNVGGEAWMHEHMSALGMKIGGGTSEIQRTLIGERVLGLPRDPSMS